MPRNAPEAKTSACAASSQTLPVIRTITKTTRVISAPNRGPLGSISICGVPSAVLTLDPGIPRLVMPARPCGPGGLSVAFAQLSLRAGRRRRLPVPRRTLRCRDTAEIYRAPPGQRRVDDNYPYFRPDDWIIHLMSPRPAPR